MRKPKVPVRMPSEVVREPFYPLDEVIAQTCHQELAQRLITLLTLKPALPRRGPQLVDLLQQMFGAQPPPLTGIQPDSITLPTSLHVKGSLPSGLHARHDSVSIWTKASALISTLVNRGLLLHRFEQLALSQHDDRVEMDPEPVAACAPTRRMGEAW